MVKLDFLNIKFLLYRFRYLINYIIIGFFAVGLEVSLIKYFSYIGINPWLSVPIGFVSGVIFSFILNAKINFRIPKSKNTKTFFLFLTISTISFFLNLLLIKVLSYHINEEYGITRFITAACIFGISYLAHRKITFNFVKQVGIAIYLNRNESISEIYSKIKNYSDFIHIDLIDQTIDKKAEIDLSPLTKINELWSSKKMLHIMSKNPKKWITLLYPKVDSIVFHLDIENNIIETIKLCKKYNKKVGIAIMPKDSLEIIKPYLKYLDYVQIMGISQLGKSGQNFEIESILLVKRLKELQNRYKYKIIFDGGLKPTNVNRIDADYLVAASGILQSDNPLQSFLEIKTSARYRDVREELRKDIISGIKDKVNSIDFIESGNLVGSFAEGKKLEGASDIDIVIITDKLNKDKYEHIINEFTLLKNKLESKYGYPIYLNNSFGPLKFNGDNIVFHIMIYDLESHKKHCEESPFTCYDWERSRLFIKKSLKEIYRATHIEPNNFFNARRSIEDYIKDLQEERVSYRIYEFDKFGNIIEVKKYKQMKERGKVEFAYTVVKFLMSNYLKLYYRKNINYSLDELIKRYFSICKLNKKEHSIFIKKLKIARDSGKELSNILELTKRFILDFKKQFDLHIYKNSTSVFFIRHGRTKLNKKGIYLGQKSDISIENIDKKELAKVKIKAEVIYSSPLKRAIETLQKILPNQNIDIDNSLIEIDYGKAEKKDVKWLQANYPEIIDSWKNGIDARFPDGENSRDVIKRVVPFMNKLHNKHKGKKIVVCTHNVILRSLIGHYSGIPLRDWFKINIPHLTPIKFIITSDGKIYPDLSIEQKKEIFKNF